MNNKYTINEGNDTLKRVRLMMQYQLGKTLNENIEVISEQPDSKFDTPETKSILRKGQEELDKKQAVKDVENKSTGVWSSVTKKFSTTHDKLGGIKLCCLNYTLCQHYGNDDSKLHPKHRLKTPIVAHNFYDDFYGEEIKIISTSGTVSEPNNFIKKKRPDGTSNGNAIEVKKPEPPKAIVINNKKAILPNSEKLHKPNNPISKIGDDALLAKIRRRNTGFGGRR
jgi:hypothetical protein